MGKAYALTGLRLDERLSEALPIRSRDNARAALNDPAQRTRKSRCDAGRTWRPSARSRPALAASAPPKAARMAA